MEKQGTKGYCDMSRLAEPIATGCNILSNVVVLRCMWRDPTSPMPRGALVLQVCANVSWFTFATLRGDAYLATTALTSLIIQMSSLVLRSRHRSPPKKSIRLDTSSDELQQFPPPS
jgi:hypothetical protein